MKRLVTEELSPIRDERWRWPVDAQGRVAHRDGTYYLNHEAKTLYVRERGSWQKLGYWCDRCGVGLLLERGSTGDVDTARSTTVDSSGGKEQLSTSSSLSESR